MGPIRPVFSKKMPPNAREFFDSRSDEDFKREHPVAYPILVAVGILVLVLPYFALALTWQFALGRDLFNTVWAAVAFAGGFVFGIGLFNLIAAFLNQYLGHMVTVACLAVGACVMAVAAYYALPV